MFVKITDKQFSYTPDQIEKIRQDLWAKELSRSNTCPDCGAKSGEDHMPGCDVPRCKECGIQAIQCDNESHTVEKWSGLWPGIKKCYDRSMIVWDTATSSWGFDLNSVHLIKAFSEVLWVDSTKESIYERMKQLLDEAGIEYTAFIHDNTDTKFSKPMTNVHLCIRIDDDVEYYKAESIFNDNFKQGEIESSLDEV